MTLDKRVAGSSVGFNGAKPVTQKPGLKAMASAPVPSSPSTAATADYERTRQAHNAGLVTQDELAQSAVRAHQRIVKIGGVQPYTPPEPRATQSSQSSGGRWDSFKATLKDKFSSVTTTPSAPTNPMTTLVANLNRERRPA